MWRKRSCTVIVRAAFLRSTPTVISLNSGRYSATGAAMSSRPSSPSIIAASEVKGLVIEAMRKIESYPIFAPASLSRKPIASA